MSTCSRFKNLGLETAFCLLFLALFFCPLCVSLPSRIFEHELRQQDWQTSRIAASNGVYHRTGYHFQPSKNWMNDPNGPMFHEGFYHLFYQYNPYSAVWGNITWGHAVSNDMLRWSYLEPALEPDQWYDIKGVWSGSASFIDGKPVLLYTGWSNGSDQMQSMAIPEDPYDPLLRKWKKIPQNPIAVAPTGINSSDFRDPTTAWLGRDGLWRILVGSKHTVNHTGIALIYTSPDFYNWTLVDHPLYSGAGTGMWECPDFYPVSLSGNFGLDTSTNGSHLAHVLKVSLDDRRYDSYIVGSYDEDSDCFTPHHDYSNAITVLRYDYGVFYASKTFYDTSRGRRILWGWIQETDTSADDLAKGWACVQAIPRRIWLDDENLNMLRQWPVEEVETLRSNYFIQEDVLIKPGQTIEIEGCKGSMLDIEVHFNIEEHKHKLGGLKVDADDAKVICNQTKNEDLIASFGLYVLASKDLRERTAISFKLARSKEGVHSVVCSDQRRSSLTSSNVTKTVYGSFVNVVKGEHLSARLLVDHSIVETFAQGGRVVITSRAYPSKAIEENANLFFFNDGKSTIRATNITVWRLQKTTFSTL